MKILFISHYSFLYGSNRSLYSLIEYFKKQGMEVEVLLPTKREFYKILKENGFKVYSLMFLYEVLYIKLKFKYLILPLLWFYDFIVLPILYFKIKKINPDIIYTNSSVDAFSVWIAKLLKKKHVVHIREFMYEDFGALFLFGQKAKSWYLKKSDKIICVSKAVANSVFGQLPKNAKIIYNGVAAPKFVHHMSKLTPKLRLGVVGNIDVSKQQDKAIMYMANLVQIYPDITLHIIGDKNCSYKKYILNLVKKLHLEKSVIFEGFEKNIDDIYNKFDVLLMCSRSEGFGRVTVEAMQRFIPVIGYDSGGTSELIKDGVTGFKFLQYKEVECAITQLITDSNILQSIVNNAYNDVITNFSEEKYVHDVYDFVVS